MKYKTNILYLPTQDQYLEHIDMEEDSFELKANHSLQPYYWSLTE